MSTARLVLSTLLLATLSVAALARESVDAESVDVVTAATTADGLRFTAGAAAVQMRVEFLSGVVAAFDSGWRDGNVFDWAATSEEQPLASGSYRCTVTAKDLQGRVMQKEALVTVRGAQISIEAVTGDQSVAIVTAGEPKLTALTHDGKDSAVVSTAGDLTFRFGNYLAGKDAGRMRFTREGSLGIGTDDPKATLDVNGLIRASKGIVFEDGTILTSGSTDAVRRSGLALERPGDVTLLGQSPAPLPLGRRISGGKTSNAFTPGYQFTVNDTGVSVGTTNPAFKLDVTGTVNTNTAYKIGGASLIIASLQQQGSTVIGEAAGLSNTGLSNTFVGRQAGWYNTSGNYNSFFGYQAGASNVTGGSNSYFGNFAGVFSTGSDDTFIGASAGFKNSTASQNTAVGSFALYNNQTSTGSTAIGYHALYASTRGNNVAVGSLALALSTTGYGNIAIGNGAGSNITTGSYNIYIDSLGGGETESNTIRIGQSTWHSRAFMAGISNTTPPNNAVPVVIDYQGQLGVASSSRRYKFDIVDLDDRTDALMSLRPVTFRYLAHGDTGPQQYGLIAEEVAAIYPELVTRNEKGEPEAVMYQFLPPMLLNHVQKQQRTIDEQQRTIEALSERVEALARQVEDLQRTAARY